MITDGMCYSLECLLDRFNQTGEYEEEVQRGEEMVHALEKESKNLRKTEEWNDYFQVVHAIENWEGPTIQKACEFSRRLKKTCSGQGNVVRRVHKIQSVLNRWYAYKRSRKMPKNTTQRTILVQQNPPKLSIAYKEFRKKLLEMVKVSEGVFHSFKEDIKKEKTLEKESLNRVGEAIINLEKQLLRDKCDAITLYYAMLWYRDLRKERRELKNNIEMYQDIQKFDVELIMKNTVDDLHKIDRFIQNRTAYNRRLEERIKETKKYA
ncbi:hypothetical protein IMZ31_22635 (plasmid) [Pontibacillus sp. ALD_SL1]|uniref:hypothetical protein n=1 Tax=Pontibacillus sp. ALD_SL1 TaxID=2777185 RepID=UPI001A97952D|nr:hypothetical protein [Pontibacillus sp. ALD_SL1]QST02254.1 hypothetical protein IMZ31_22635 [Pontibacillus sp. ALD_SL1]